MLLETFDNEIEKSINKLINAKTGTEVRAFIVEFEELMFARTKLFTRMIMQEKRDKENETEAQTAQVAKNSKLIEETLNSIRNYTGEDFIKEESKKPMEKATEVEGVLTANNICADSLTQKEVRRRVADALLNFIERVSNGRSTARVSDAESAVFPDVVRVLLELSRQLPLYIQTNVLNAPTACHVSSMADDNVQTNVDDAPTACCVSNIDKELGEMSCKTLRG